MLSCEEQLFTSNKWQTTKIIKAMIKM